MHEEDEIEMWYWSVRPELVRLEGTIKGLISGALQAEGIEFLQIQTRLKDASSLTQKVSRKSYTKISDVTDLVGARIIVFLENDVLRVRELMSKLFEIDASNSTDHRKKGTNLVGYQSLHLVCQLGEKRSSFLEYRGITGISFEIQIRTALQHAWAEIEHKQNYKTVNSLPPNLQRRLVLVSANLESIDREFSEIVGLAKNYEDLVEKAIPSVDSDDMSDAALVGIYRHAVSKLGIRRYSAPGHDRMLGPNLVSIVHACGYETVGQTRELVLGTSKAEVRSIAKRFKKLTADRLIKFSLIRKDADRYVKVASDFGITLVGRSVIEFYDLNFPEMKLREKLAAIGVSVVDHLD